MWRRKALGWVVLLGGVVMALSGCSEALVVEISETQFGARSQLGNGTVSSYVEFDGRGTPLAIGLTFSADAFDGLPSGSDFHHCFDRNEDGVVDQDTEFSCAALPLLPFLGLFPRPAEVLCISLSWASIFSS